MPPPAAPSRLRVCCQCRQPLTAAQPVAQPVALRLLAPGVAAYGALCAACAGQPATTPPGAQLVDAIVALSKQGDTLALDLLRKRVAKMQRGQALAASEWRVGAVRCTECRYAAVPKGFIAPQPCPGGLQHINSHQRRCPHYAPA